MSRIIDTLSLLAAKQKLVPFMGAGCSASMMPDWDTLSREMSEQLGLTEIDDNLKIAQKYVDTLGRDNFCAFLRSKLEISDFDDETGYIHLIVMNMGVSSIYTTNQDNVMEKAYQKYGKNYRAIIQLEDFAETKLSEQLYIKFHGDLNYPESIVFTQEDYERRINEPQNALDIRLRSDLLAKNLLFIGYSFRDINIQQMFTELQKAFYGKLPTSYMIAYMYNDKLQSLCDEYGIILIDPMKEFPESKDHVAAFEMLLKCMMEEARSKKCENEIRELLSTRHSRIVKVVSKQEIELLEDTIKNKPFSTGVQLFREVCDSSNIPLDYEKRIVNVYIGLCKTVKTDKDTESLKSASYNLKLNNSLSKFKILAALMASTNVKTPHGNYGENRSFISMETVSQRICIVVSAKAIEYIYSWGWLPTPPFTWNIGRWMDKGTSFDSLDEKVQKYIMHWLDKMRLDCKTVAEHPIKRQHRLRDHSFVNPSVSLILTEDEINLLNELISHKC
ncbi:SIR2 family protein (plasmid) [Clostridium estertheticum]|uniref:SIR2 family NAD-dependent protein deacylase n=1 Tax=Clostridium estertheticum TaxID=238834 RepID=UPI001C0C4352|nr:SIR2 family protein [Clostridium estertheticum]MBU3218267.1 SIR2 family protein [Clostridium estertheticum]WAG58227.1 SIR2 family protein [Clostridium estertheticum]